MVRILLFFIKVFFNVFTKILGCQLNIHKAQVKLHILTYLLTYCPFTCWHVGQQTTVLTFQNSILVLHLGSPLPFDLSVRLGWPYQEIDKSPAGIALRVIETHKPPDQVKVVILRWVELHMRRTKLQFESIPTGTSRPFG